MPSYVSPTQDMITTYQRERERDDHRERLESVNIELIAATASRDKDDEPRGEALRRGGNISLADIAITTLLERSRARERGEVPVDVAIVINADRWESATVKMQRAVLDRCLTMIEVLTKDDAPVLDAAERPKIRRRRPDRTIEFYDDVAERHGDAAVEVHQLRVMISETGQVYMPWLDDTSRVDNAAFAPIPKKVPAEKAATQGKGKRGRKAIDGAKPIAASGYSLGTCKPKLVRERLGHIKRPETILGVVALLFAANKMDKGMKAAVTEAASRLDIIEDVRALQQGNEPSRKPDLAAGVLVTSPKDLEPSVLDQLVPECDDQVVLEWIIEDEEARADGEREAVTEVVHERIRMLSGEARVH